MALKLTSSSLPEKRIEDMILLHTPEGVGKSTWAKGAERPGFADSDFSLGELNVPSRRINTYEDFLEFVNEFPDQECRTAVVDTIDKLDALYQQYICKKRGWNHGIESPGYGKGWTYLQEEWLELLDMLEVKLRAKGIEVILLAHSHVGKFINPDGSDFNGFTPKINEKVCGVIKDACSQIFFGCPENIVVTKKSNTENPVNLTGKGQTTGRRIMYTEWTPGHVAKNRYGLPEELSLDYKVFAEHRAAFWKAMDDNLGSARPAPAVAQVVAPPVAPPPVVAPTPAAAPPAVEATGEVLTPVTPPAAPPAEVKASEPLTKTDVGQCLSVWGTVFQVMDISKIKEKFLAPYNVPSLADASDRAKESIATDVIKSFDEAGKKRPEVIVAMANRLGYTGGEF